MVASGIDVGAGFGVGSTGSFVAGVFVGSGADRTAVDDSGVLVGRGDMVTVAIEPCVAITGGATVAVGSVGIETSAGVRCGVEADGTAVASIFIEDAVGVACATARADPEEAGELRVDEVP